MLDSTVYLYRIFILIKTPFEDGNNHSPAQVLKHLVVPMLFT